MEIFLRTLSWATDVGGKAAAASVDKSQKPDSVWFVVIRCVMALLCAGFARLFLWFTGDRFIGSVFGVGIVWLLRFWMAGSLEGGGAARAARNIAGSRQLSQEGGALMAAVAPLAYFLLCYRGNWFWLIPAWALAAAVAATACGEAFSRKSPAFAWIVAVAVSVLGCGFASRLGWAGQSLFMLSLFSSVFAWLMPIVMEKFWPEERFESGRERCSSMLAVAEVAVLVIGVLGLAI